jgi:hypothetical protein
VLLVAALLLGAPAHAAVQLLGSEDALSVSATTGSDEATTYVTVFNDGKTISRLTASFNASSQSTVKIKSVSPATIAAGQVVRAAIVFTGLKALGDSVSGQLIVDGDGTPSSRPITITPAPQPLLNWAEAIIIGVIAVIFALMIAIFVSAVSDGKASLLTKQAPGPKWSFDSWATTSTALGALLGVVLGSAVLPDVPRQIAKDSLIAMNLVFGGMVVVAPFIFQAVRRSGASPADQDAGLWGYNWVLALACSITCGAVLGELATLSLVGWEVAGPNVWRYVLLLALLLLAILATGYFFTTARELATTDWAALVEKDKQRARREDSALKGFAGTGATAAEDETAEVTVPRRAWSLP